MDKEEARQQGGVVDEVIQANIQEIQTQHLEQDGVGGRVIVMYDTSEEYDEMGHNLGVHGEEFWTSLSPRMRDVARRVMPHVHPKEEEFATFFFTTYKGKFRQLSLRCVKTPELH